MVSVSDSGAGTGAFWTICLASAFGAVLAVNRTLDGETAQAIVETPAGRLLWACWTDGHLEICSGATPGSRPSEEIARLFVAALREHYGEAASAIAERYGAHDDSDQGEAAQKQTRRAEGAARRRSGTGGRRWGLGRSGTQ